jgi:hypothetical protein
MTLSVCCLAGAPGPRVRALLEPLRPLADEIVVGADARLDAATLAEYASVADRVLRVDVSYLERHLGWLHSHCTGDWIFRIDADEVAGAGLLAAIPKLMQDRQVRQYWIPRLWLYRDTRSACDGPPWWPDYQLRLYRRDALLRFSGQLHTSSVSVPPSGYIEEPLYHLDLLVNDFASRERKAHTYDAMRPGMRAPGGGPLNERLYLPELDGDLRLRTVDAHDAERIDAVLAAKPRASDTSGPDIPVTSQTENDRWLEGKPFDADVHRAVIEPLETEVKMTPTEERVVHFRVTNVGNEPWPYHNPEIYEGRQVRLSYHWLNLDGTFCEFDGIRTWLPRRLDPGKSTVVPMMLRAPAAPGKYTLEVDLVHERWFGSALRLPAAVVAPRVAASAELAEVTTRRSRWRRS